MFNKNKNVSKDPNIYIIGAGISGLISAVILEQHGYSPVIIEETESVGGRVKTDVVEGYQLDRGFQVLLTAYPAVQRYIDTTDLNLQMFAPGAAILAKGKYTCIGDPIRDTSLLFSTLFSDIGTLTDKFKVLQLNKLLKRKAIPEIFEAEEKTTLSYLKDFGFTSQMINKFFRPFFSGIFLEPNLKTSSRMFEFIYKMFGEGYASLPISGIGAIPRQLAKSLKRTTIEYNTRVGSVQEGVLILSNGKRIKSDFTIVATDANKLVQSFSGPLVQWRSCDTLYFETATRNIDKPLIGLIPDQKALINNIFFHTSLGMATKAQAELLSVTIVKDHELPEDALLSRVQEELKEYCGIDACRFIKRYTISRALPDLKDIQYEIVPLDTEIAPRIFLAGDLQLNGSMNAAMISGERAALGVIETIKGSNFS